MLKGKTVEILVGLFVVAGFGGLFFLAMQVSNLSSFQHDDGYILKARFENVGSLRVRSPVSMSGVRIGRVTAINYDNEDLLAIVEIMIDSRYDVLTEDARASIYTAGLLGEQYIALTPGGGEEYLKDNDFIQETDSALVLEELIGKFFLSKAEGK